MPSLVASNQASFSISSEAAMLSEVLKAFIQEVDDQDGNKQSLNALYE